MIVTYQEDLCALVNGFTKYRLGPAPRETYTQENFELVKEINKKCVEEACDKIGMMQYYENLPLPKHMCPDGEKNLLRNNKEMFDWENLVFENEQSLSEYERSLPKDLKQPDAQQSLSMPEDPE